MNGARLLLLGGVGCAGAYALLALGAFFGQRALMYPAPSPARQPVSTRARLLRVPAAGGRPVFALHAPAPPGAPTLAFFHGNGEQLSDVAPLVDALAARDLGVLAPEYPGYGLAAGFESSEQGIYADAETALAYARTELGVSPSSLLLCGHSLGTGVAMEMARRGLGGRLALLSPMTSMVDMAGRVLPFLPARLLVRDRYDSLAKAPDVELPALVVHGERDALIPPSMGRRVAEALPRGRFVGLDGAGHNDLFSRGGEPLLEMLAGFARGD